MIEQATYPHVSDDQILAALFGETVDVRGLNYDYTLRYLPEMEYNQFELVFKLGVVNVDEDNLRLINLV